MRTDRPALPTRPTDLTKTERLQPLTAKAAGGNDVAIDRDVLEELYTRLGEAIGAVERDNNRITGSNRLWSCVEQVFATGKAAGECVAYK